MACEMAFDVEHFINAEELLGGYSGCEDTAVATQIIRSQSLQLDSLFHDLAEDSIFLLPTHPTLEHMAAMPHSAPPLAAIRSRRPLTAPPQPALVPSPRAVHALEAMALASQSTSASPVLSGESGDCQQVCPTSGGSSTSCVQLQSASERRASGGCAAQHQTPDAETLSAQHRRKQEQNRKDQLNCRQRHKRKADECQQRVEVLQRRVCEETAVKHCISTATAALQSRMTQPSAVARLSFDSAAPAAFHLGHAAAAETALLGECLTRCNIADATWLAQQPQSVPADLLAIGKLAIECVRYMLEESRADRDSSAQLMYSCLLRAMVQVLYLLFKSQPQLWFVLAVPTYATTTTGFPDRLANSILAELELTPPQYAALREARQALASTLDLTERRRSQIFRLLQTVPLLPDSSIAHAILFDNASKASSHLKCVMEQEGTAYFGFYNAVLQTLLPQQAAQFLVRAHYNGLIAGLLKLCSLL